MKKFIVMFVILAGIVAGTASAWHADGVSRDCAGTVTIDQSNDWPGAFIVSDDGSTVVIGWQGSEDTQTFQNVNGPEDCTPPPPPPPPPPTHDCVYTGAGKDGAEGNDDCAVVVPEVVPVGETVTVPAGATVTVNDKPVVVKDGVVKITKPGVTIVKVENKVVKVIGSPKPASGKNLTG